MPCATRSTKSASIISSAPYARECRLLGTENKIIDRRKRCSEYNDPTADVELVSSDDYVFRVHSYQLMAASVVFRTMLTDLRSDSSTPVIPLVDPDIEKYHSVKALLDLIHHGTIPDSLLKNLSRLSHLAKLTMKFDCSLVQGILRMRMQNSLAQEPGWSYIIFIVAAQLDDAAICRAAIPVAGRLIWLGEATKPIPFSDESIKGASVLDLAAMKDSEFEAIPFKYSRALARASRTDGPNGKKDWDVIADEFYRQVTRQELPEKK